MATLTAEQLKYQADCVTDHDVAEWRLSTMYSRDPSRRKEARLEMRVADTLQHDRDRMVFCEFSQTWNKRDGGQP